MGAEYPDAVVTSATMPHPRTVVFVFDYVMHYHSAVLRRIAAHVEGRGGTFVLLTATPRAVAAGRVPLREPIVEDQRYYTLHEWHIGSFTIRHQQGLARHLLEIRPDVVVTMCHSGTTTEWLAIALKGVLRYRLVAWQSGYEYNPGHLKTFVLRRFVPRFDHHLAYHSNAERFALLHGAKAQQITVMHNTIDESAVALIPKDEARRGLEAAFPGISGRTIVLYVGAVLGEKRLEAVVAALTKLQREQLAFVVVGDGPHLSVLRSMCGTRDDVYFAGRVIDGVGRYFDAADVFVLPGTGGLAINEAMAHGLPVIAGYADGSADDLVVDGLNGYRLRSESVEELSEHLATLIGDRSLRERMGRASLDMIRRTFSFESFVNRVTSVLDRV